MQTCLPGIIWSANIPGGEHAHGQLFVPPPPPVYSAFVGPPHDIISSSMFVHSTASAPLQYWPVEAVHGCSESERVAAVGPAMARRVAAESMELLLGPQSKFCLDLMVLLGRRELEASSTASGGRRATMLLLAGALASFHGGAPSRGVVRQRARLVGVATVEEPDLASQMDATAITLEGAPVRPQRGPDGRLLPVLTLPGDTLDDTQPMAGLTAASTVLAVGVIGRAFAASGGVPALVGVALGGVAGELFSGTFHWATDNYGRLETPVVGFACAAFQGHHLAPWTISHRSFPNNVYKIAAATLPLFLLGLALLPPAGAAFVATLFYSQVLAQEFHRWSHTPANLLAPWQRPRQAGGGAQARKVRDGHHRPPFDKHYCILTGGLNKLLDSEPLWFWRRLEALVYRWNGQEPNCWKHDPRVKELALRL